MYLVYNNVPDNMSINSIVHQNVIKIFSVIRNTWIFTKTFTRPLYWFMHEPHSLPWLRKWPWTLRKQHLFYRFAYIDQNGIFFLWCFVVSQYYCHTEILGDIVFKFCQSNSLLQDVRDIEREIYWPRKLKLVLKRKRPHTFVSTNKTEKSQLL